LSPSFLKEKPAFSVKTYFTANASKSSLKFYRALLCRRLPVWRAVGIFRVITRHPLQAEYAEIDEINVAVRLEIAFGTVVVPAQSV